MLLGGVRQRPSRRRVDFSAIVQVLMRDTTSPPSSNQTNSNSTPQHTQETSQTEASPPSAPWTSESCSLKRYVRPACPFFPLQPSALSCGRSRRVCPLDCCPTPYPTHACRLSLKLRLPLKTRFLVAQASSSIPLSVPLQSPHPSLPSTPLTPPPQPGHRWRLLPPPPRRAASANPQAKTRRILVSTPAHGHYHHHTSALDPPSRRRRRGFLRS